MENSPILYLVRGIPGSGKSTFAKKLANSPIVLEADQFFVKNGQYQFNATKLGKAHNEFVRASALNMMKNFKNDICIANTFMYPNHMEPFFEMAKQFGYTVKIYHCFYHDINIDYMTEDEIEHDCENKTNSRFNPISIKKSEHFKNLSKTEQNFIVDKYRTIIHDKQINNSWDFAFRQYNEVISENMNVHNFKYYNGESENIVKWVTIIKPWKNSDIK